MDLISITKIIHEQYFYKLIIQVHNILVHWKTTTNGAYRIPDV